MRLFYVFQKDIIVNRFRPFFKRPDYRTCLLFGFVPTLVVVRQHFIGLRLSLVEFANVYKRLGCQRVILIERLRKFTSGMCPHSNISVPYSALQSGRRHYPPSPGITPLIVFQEFPCRMSTTGVHDYSHIRLQTDIFSDSNTSWRMTRPAPAVRRGNL